MAKKQILLLLVSILCMKPILTLLAALILVSVTGCRSLGYNDRSANNSLTPEVSEKVQVRTYDQNGNPTVTSAPSPAKTDPSSPDYQPNAASAK